jgi:arsenate reductase (thioredoxin)
MKILILCTGNSCRSQMAHGFMKTIDPTLQVYSAGTHPATVVNPNAIAVMHELGIDISTHTPTLVDTYIHEEWDYVITVCGGAKEVCPAFIGKVKHRLHIGFEDPADVVGDPEYVLSEYRRIRDLIRHEFENVLYPTLKNE